MKLYPAVVIAAALVALVSVIAFAPGADAKPGENTIVLLFCVPRPDMHGYAEITIDGNSFGLKCDAKRRLARVNVGTVFNWDVVMTIESGEAARSHSCRYHGSQVPVHRRCQMARHDLHFAIVGGGLGNPNLTPTPSPTPTPPPSATPTPTPSPSPTPSPTPTPTPTPSPTPSPTPTPTPTPSPTPSPTPDPTPTPQPDGADVKMVSVFVSAPATQTAGVTFAVSATANIHNNGPIGPVLVDTTFSFGTTVGCTFTPTSPVIVQNKNAPVSIPVAISKTWLVTCTSAGAHTFTVNAATAIDVSQSTLDPVPDNNTGVGSANTVVQ